MTNLGAMPQTDPAIAEDPADGLGGCARIRRDLSQAGVTPQVAEAALSIDATMQRWRRRFSRRTVERRAIEDLSLELDVPRLDALIAIAAPATEYGPDPGEVMVATVADRLGTDPSRASRVVADLIASGHARRAVSQRDARRTIVELTAKGQAAVQAVRAYKIGLLAQNLASWTPEELAVFAPLLDRLSLMSASEPRKD